MKFKALILLCCVLIYPSQSIAIDSEFTSVKINYLVDMVSKKWGNATLGNLETHIQTNGEDKYSVHSKTKTQGLASILMGSNIEETCAFETNNNQVVSQQYNSGQSNNGNFDFAVQFDWEERKINFADTTLDMPQGYVVDNCNFPFAAAFSKGHELKGKTIYVVDGKSKRIRGYTFRSLSDEVLDIKLGKLDTLKIVLERELRPDRTFTFWLAKEKQFMPIKMEEKRESRTTTMLAQNISFDAIEAETAQNDSN